LRGKLDSRLHHRLRELESRPQRGEPDDPALGAQRVGVWVEFSSQGGLEAAKAAGFRPDTVAGDIAGGTVALRDLEAVAASEGVVSVRSVQQYRRLLKDSVPAIHADHSTVTTVGGGSGAGAIVGVVDTGIDVLHHNFRKSDGTTRILALLDLTLRQTISITGAATGGTFTLAWSGLAKTPLSSPLPNTGALPFSASAGAIQTALLAMRNAAGAAVVNAADITVVYSVEGPPFIELIESQDDGVWGHQHGEGLHHIGLWEDDVTARLAELAAQGITADLEIFLGDDVLYAAYLPPSALHNTRLEIVTRQRPG